MWAFIDKIPYPILIAISVLMILAPFKSVPHVLEKIIILKNGTLTRPIDIFDLFYHLVPTIILFLKIISRSKKGIDTANLMKKTGFNQKKVTNILQRTFKAGKIKRAAKGIYVSA